MQPSPLQKSNIAAPKVISNAISNKTGLRLPAAPILGNQPLQKKELDQEPIQTKIPVQQKNDTGGVADMASPSNNNINKPENTVDNSETLGHEKFSLQPKETGDEPVAIQGNFLSFKIAAKEAENMVVQQPVQRFVLPKQPTQAPACGQGALSNNVVQRIVTKNTDGTWGSDLSALKLKKYTTPEEAENAESTIFITKPGKRKNTRKKLAPKDLRDVRRPTLYGVIGESAKQGPHVIAHTYNATNTIAPTSSVDDLGIMFNDQILPLDQYTSIIDKAISDHAITDPIKLQRFEYAKKLYESHYNAALNIIKKDGGDITAQDSLILYDRIRRLMDLDPHATYKWMTQDATEEEMSGKGEGRSTDFHTYIDDNWASDKHLGTVHMKNFIKRRARLSKTKFRYHKYLTVNKKSAARAKEFLKIKDSEAYKKERLERHKQLQKEKRNDILKRLRGIK